MIVTAMTYIHYLLFLYLKINKLQQELAAIFKKIGEKQTCTIGLYELYRITQLYPEVSNQVYIQVSCYFSHINKPLACILLFILYLIKVLGLQ